MVADTELTPAELLAFGTPPDLELRPYPTAGRAAGRALRMGLLLLVLALLLAPWTATYVFEPLWAFLFKGNVQGSEVPYLSFFGAVWCNILFFAIVAGVGYVSCAICSGVKENITSTKALDKIRDVFQTEYATRAKALAPAVTRDNVAETVVRIRRSAFKAVGQHLDNVSINSLTFAAGPAFCLLIVAVCHASQETVLGLLPASAVVALGVAYLALVAWQVEQTFDAYAYIRAQLSDDPVKISKPRLTAGTYALALIGVILVINVDRLDKSHGPILYATPAAAANVFSAQLSRKCEYLGKTERLTPRQAIVCKATTTAVLLAAFEHAAYDADENHLVQITNRPVIRTMNFEWVQKIDVKISELLDTTYWVKRPLP